MFSAWSQNFARKNVFTQNSNLEGIFQGDFGGYGLVIKLESSCLFMVFLILKNIKMYILKFDFRVSQKFCAKNYPRSLANQQAIFQLANYLRPHLYSFDGSINLLINYGFSTKMRCIVISLFVVSIFMSCCFVFVNQLNGYSKMY